MSFRKIVAALDGSPSGRDALALGAFIAEAGRGTLVAALAEAEGLKSGTQAEGAPSGSPW